MYSRTGIRNSVGRLSCRRTVAMLGLVVIPVAAAGVVAGPAQAFGGGALRTAATPAATDGAADAFTAAGYSYADAEVLAVIWGLTGDSYDAKVAAAKAEAGGYLAQGIALNASPRADLGADDGYEQADLAGMFLDSYGAEAAETLAAAWGLPLADTKVLAGSELKTVGVLPFVDWVGPDIDPAADAFFTAGYSYQDAADLAERWGLADSYDAKIKAGTLLKAGTPLREGPFADPTADDGLTKRQLREVFANFGYTSDDAMILAGEWGVGPRAAQAEAGAELKTVGVLPYVDLKVPVPDEDLAAAQAFADAGYSYADAAVLAERWGLGDDAWSIKVKAGYELKAGTALTDSVLADPTADDGLSAKALRAVFTANGYTRDDARLLADVWGVSVKEATTRAGSELLTVGVLPVVDVAGLG